MYCMGCNVIAWAASNPSTLYIYDRMNEGATVNGGNGNGNGNGKGSSKLPATIVVQLKMEEIYGWYGP